MAGSAEEEMSWPQSFFHDDVLLLLSSHVPLAQRTKALKELSEVVLTQRLEQHAVEALWLTIKDLLEEPNASEVRQLALEFITALVSGQYSRLGVLKSHFFSIIEQHNIAEDACQRLELLKVLTENGKKVEYIEEIIGPFLLKWMPEVHSTGRVSEYISLLINMVHYNAAYLDDAIVSGLVMYVCDIAKQPDSLGSMELFLDLLNAIVCYSSLPVDALVPFVTTLCHTLNVERFCEKSWQIMRKFLGTHLGHSGICTMCSLLSNRSNESDPMLLRGAVFYIAMSLWGPFKVKSLKHSFGSVLPSLRQATQSGHLIVVYEVSLSIARLVRKYGRTISLIEWDHVIGILMIVFECIEQIKNEKSTVSCNLLDSFSDVVTTIESYHNTREFNGSPDMFFALVEKCLPYRPLTSALALLLFKAELLSSSQLDWPAKVNAFLKQFYWAKQQHIEVRLKALEVLSGLVDNYRLLHEDVLMSSVVMPTFGSLASDRDIEVRSRGVQLLVSLAQHCSPEWCAKLINIISEVAQLCVSSDITAGKANEDSLQDSKVACFGLLEIFKLKLSRTPAHIAVSCYDALVHHLQQQYHSSCTSKTSCIIRLAIFNTLLNLRVASDGRVGLLEDHVIQYSSFVRRNGQQKGSEGCILDYCKTMAIVLACLKQETEWDVLSLVIHSLDKVLECRRLVSCCVDRMNDLCSALCYMVSNQQEWLRRVINIPSSVARSDLSALIYPVLKVLCTFPEPLNRTSQCKLVQSFEYGVVGPSAHLCVTGLAVCSLELQLTMSRVLPAILLKMGQISATPTMAVPVLQFLSNVVAVPVLYTGFVEQQYLSVFAIVFPYTDARKYSSYVVALAYHVITIWFIRARIHYRRSLAKFIIKHLSDEYAYTRQHEDGDGQSQKVSLEATNRANRLSPSELQREMVEVCLDMLARYTFASVSSQITRSPGINKLLCGGQSKTWILTNALVTITTSAGPQLSEEDTKYTHHTGPMSCTHCGWAEVLIRRPTGNISWLMRLQNQMGGAVAGATVLNSPYSNEATTDMMSSLVPTPVASRTNSQSNGVEAVTNVDVDESVDSSDDQQFPIEVDGHSISTPTPTADDEPHPSEDAAATEGVAIVHNNELPQEQRSRHKSSCSLELLPPLMSYEESQAKSPSLHGGGYLTDEEQVKLVAHFAAHMTPPDIAQQKAPMAVTADAAGSISENASEDDELVILTVEDIPPNNQMPLSHTNNPMHGPVAKQQSISSQDNVTMDTILGSNKQDNIPSVARQQHRATFPQGIVRSDEEFCQSPSFVFLQLYHSSMLGPVSMDTPKLLPPGEVLDRSLKVLDHIPPYETHKIGIVYAAKNQSEESEILSNTFGSSRYMELLGGLGQLIKLSDCTPDLVYLGGLDRSGTDGEFAYFWQDEITQVIFHVATLMPNMESDHHYSNKKLHIGNNFVTIVYNNSGKSYQFGTIKGQFNYVEVIVEPLDMAVNRVFTQCTAGLESMMYGGPYLISDQWLPVLVRQMALHANLASVVHKCSHTPSSGDHYLSNWLGRLRKIARIRDKAAMEDHTVMGLQDFTAYT